MLPELSFHFRDKAKETYAKLRDFAEKVVAPAEKVFEEQVNEGDRWQPTAIMEELKREARARGLWNLFLPESEYGAGFTNLEYAPFAELTGYYPLLSEATNCSAPDTGNMEVLARYGTKAQQERWLKPLLAGEIRSAFCMTEPDVASSDATNIQARIESDGDDYVLNGRKWWSSGAGDPRCAVFIFMGKTDPSAPRHLQQTMLVVPRDTKGITIKRMLKVFGYDHAPHGHAEIEFKDVRVKKQDSLLLGEGRGFEIAQGRLGPGRIHHCMRSIGVAERALALMCDRVEKRVAFGRRLSEMGTIRHDIAMSRIEIDQARMLVMRAAYMMDTVGNKGARQEIAAIKVVAPNVSLRVLDRAIQAHGGMGVCQDTFLASAWANQRTLRLADGPDEVHIDQIARLELGKYRKDKKDAH